MGVSDEGPERKRVGCRGAGCGGNIMVLFYSIGRVMFSIAFVCTGNACRSPFAECVMRRMLEESGMSGVNVCSMGTLDWGKNPRDADMRQVAEEMGYALTGTTTSMTREALFAADLVIVFEARQRDAVTRVLDYSHWDRIVLFDRVAFGRDGEVEDPCGQRSDVYRAVAAHIEEGCRSLVREWQERPPKIE